MMTTTAFLITANTTTETTFAKIFGPNVAHGNSVTSDDFIVSVLVISLVIFVFLVQ